MGREPDGQEGNDHNMGVKDNAFFYLEVSSKSDENSEYSFHDEIYAGVNFWELLANFLLELHESKRVSGVAYEFVVCHLENLLNLLNLHQSTELTDLVRRYEIDITPELKDSKSFYQARSPEL